MTVSETLAIQMKMYLYDWEICPQQRLKQMNWSAELIILDVILLFKNFFNVLQSQLSHLLFFLLEQLSHCQSENFRNIFLNNLFLLLTQSLSLTSCTLSEFGYSLIS